MVVTYDTVRQPEYQALSSNVSSLHLRAAARYLYDRFRNRNVTIAIMGGFSVVLRGGPRRTFDVDIAVGSNMGVIRQALVDEERVILPAGPVSGVMRIFVWTGGHWDDSSTHLQLVEVDLLTQGHNGAPSDVAHEREMIPVLAFPTQFNLPIINLLNILKSKLGAYFNRRSENDLRDLAFLVRKYRNNIPPLRSQLSSNERREFIRGAIAANLPNPDRLRQIMAVNL